MHMHFNPISYWIFIHTGTPTSFNFFFINNRKKHEHKLNPTNYYLDEYSMDFYFPNLYIESTLPSLRNKKLAVNETIAIFLFETHKKCRNF